MNGATEIGAGKIYSFVTVSGADQDLTFFKKSFPL